MTNNSQRPREQDNALSLLNMAIDGLNLAKELSCITPAAAVFGSVSVLLTVIRDTMANEQDYIELGLSCADICKALDRGMNGKKLDDLGRSICDAINQLTTTVAEIQKKIIKHGGRNKVFRFFHARNDMDMIANWKSDLNRILAIFNAELALNTHTIVADIHQNMLKTRDATDGKNLATRNGARGEPPPPPPRVFFGRGELIDEVVGFTEQLTPVALIGAGGIGKTSVILTVLHDDRIKQRFGDNRWFIRCDQFPASHAYLLRRLSKVIGAGVKNPKDLTSLRQYLSSREMFIVLDNAESILDPQGANAQEIYSVVDELTQFSNICLSITSRISTIPPGCETLEVPTLSIEAASDTFYRIYKHGERSDLINDILEELDFHPLSITLLATVAQQNKWDTSRLTKEWRRQRTGVLHARHSGSLGSTVEISLASPMFQELGPDARELLGVIAFFPHGVDENNIEWLFSTIPDGPVVFDKFCILSLTYRSNGFIMMLAPLRDYLCLKDPRSSPLLNATKERYFSRLLEVDVHPDKPGFEESRWIMSEDVNVEHLLDIFMSIDANLESIWKVSEAFMDHIIWHKPRFVMLGPKIEALPDDHPSKAQCIRNLSWSFHSIGNWVEHKRLLNHSLKLWRERGNDREVAETLCYLSEANRLMNLYKEGIQDGKNASEIFERLGDKSRQAECLIGLAYVLRDDKQLDAAEETASRAIDLLPEKGQRFLACDGHRALGNIHQSKGDTEKAIHHFRVALEIGSPLNYHTVLFWIHYSLAELFFEQGTFDGAHAHVERAKSHAINNQYQYLLGRALLLRARFLDQRHSLEEAKSEALHALEVFERLGAADDVEETREFLGELDLELFTPVESAGSDHKVGAMVA